MDAFLVLDLATWAVIGGTFMPIVVGILTKINLHAGVKAVVNLVLSTVYGLIAVANETDGILTEAAVFAAGLTLLTSVAMHFGIWKPMIVTGAGGVVQQKTDGIGIGPSSRAAV